MEVIKPLMASNRFENCLIPFSEIPDEDSLSGREESDSEMITKSTKQIDLRSLPQLRISLERTCFPGQTTTKTVDRTENLSVVKKMLSGSESDDSSETIVLNQDISDKILSVNRDMELMEVESDVSSQGSVISSEDNQNINVINFEWKEEDSKSDDTPVVIHDASEIFVRLERIQLPKKHESENDFQGIDECDEVEDKSEMNDEIQEIDECDEIENISEMKDTSAILLRKCFVKLERINIETVTRIDVDDLSSPEGPSSGSATYYGYHLPEAVIRLKRTPVSVFRQYGITIPNQSSSASCESSRSYTTQEDRKLYCVLGIKLLFQKRKQESLFGQRVAELRDFIIPNRNKVKMQLRAKRRLKRLNRKSLSSRRLEYDNGGREILETDANTP